MGDNFPDLSPLQHKTSLFLDVHLNTPSLHCRNPLVIRGCYGGRGEEGGLNKQINELFIRIVP